jgi:hypothetical protein
MAMMSYKPRISNATIVGITQIDGEHGVYVVDIIFDGVPQVIHVELEGSKTSFKVRERIFAEYRVRCPDLRWFPRLMRAWHRGERCELPVNLATVPFR